VLTIDVVVGLVGFLERGEELLVELGRALPGRFGGLVDRELVDEVLELVGDLADLDVGSPDDALLLIGFVLGNVSGGECSGLLIIGWDSQCRFAACMAWIRHPIVLSCGRFL